MEHKVIKFRDHLAQLVLTGEKDLTWRLFDDKDLKKGDVVDLMNWNTREIFGTAKLLDVWKKKMGDLEESDFEVLALVPQFF